MGSRPPLPSPPRPPNGHGSRQRRATCHEMKIAKLKKATGTQRGWPTYKISLASLGSHVCCPQRRSARVVTCARRSGACVSSGALWDGRTDRATPGPSGVAFWGGRWKPPMLGSCGAPIVSSVWVWTCLLALYSNRDESSKVARRGVCVCAGKGLSWPE